MSAGGRSCRSSRGSRASMWWVNWISVPNPVIGLVALVVAVVAFRGAAVHAAGQAASGSTCGSGSPAGPSICSPCSFRSRVFSGCSCPIFPLLGRDRLARSIAYRVGIIAGVHRRPDRLGLHRLLVERLRLDAAVDDPGRTLPFSVDPQIRR